MEPLYGLMEVLLRRPLRCALRWRVEGTEHLPGTGPVLLASNHISYLDPLCLAYVTDLAGRRVRFLAKAELFEHRVLARALRSIGQISVDRGTADASGALEAASAALAAGQLVAVFPEGTISSDFDPMAGKTGLARLARTSGAPVVPLGLWGPHRLLTAGRRPSLRLRVAVTAAVGKPLLITPGDNPRLATDRIMEAICAQVVRARSIYPQSPRPGEGDWWVRPPETARLRSCRGRLAQTQLDEATASPETTSWLGEAAPGQP